MPVAQVQPISVPSQPGEWSIAQIIAALSRPLPPELLQQRKQGGRMLDFIPWHTANRILDKYAPGWSWEVRAVQTDETRLYLTGRLTILASDGLVWREATGTEVLKEWNEKRQTLTELSYGDPSSNAESMAFRRCAARFGLGLYLYDR